jgi:hypothetical protein
MIHERSGQVDKPGNTFTEGSSGNQNTVTVNDTLGLILMFVVALFLLRLLLIERERTYALLERRWQPYAVDREG